MNAAHNTPTCFFMIHLNIILYRSSSWFLSLWLSHQNYMHSFPSYAWYMPCPTHPPSLGHSNYNWQRVQIMKFLLMQFPLTSYYFIPVQSKYSPQHPVTYMKQYFQFYMDMECFLLLCGKNIIYKCSKQSGSERNEMAI
jgi:hypothetical protein